MGSDYSKRERLAYVEAWLRWKLGLFRRFEAVDFTRVRRVVFVCKGNICRSAYADVKLAQLGLPSASLGISARDGDPADDIAIRVAQARQIDLRGHRSTSARSFERQAGDLFACMSPYQAAHVNRHLAGADCQVLLLGTLIDTPTIHDPYGRQDDFFEMVFTQLDAAIDILAPRIRPTAYQPPNNPG